MLDVDRVQAGGDALHLLLPLAQLLDRGSKPSLKTLQENLKTKTKTQDPAIPNFSLAIPIIRTFLSHKKNRLKAKCFHLLAAAIRSRFLASGARRPPQLPLLAPSGWFSV